MKTIGCAAGRANLNSAYSMSDFNACSTAFNTNLQHHHPHQHQQQLPLLQKLSNYRQQHAANGCDSHVLGDEDRDICCNMNKTKKTRRRYCEN
jgi:hypothetical protein